MSETQSELFRGLSPADEERMISIGAPLRLQAGGVLFEMGEPAEQVYLLRRGGITLTLPMQIRGGEKDIVIEERWAGETIGWSGLIPPYRFTLKAAATRDCELLGFPRGEMLEYFRLRPEVGFTVTHNLASVIGHRLGVFQTMWLREMQRAVEQRWA